MYLFIIYVKIEGRIIMHLLEFLTVTKKEKKIRNDREVINPLHLNMGMHILLNVLITFPKVLPKKNLFNN